MKIVSLLPSATEIVFALGLGDALEGVTFECDYPPQARTKTVVSGTALPTDRPLTAREIDDEVTAKVHAGEPIYTLDAQRIRAIQPNLILAQDLCEVCAVPSGAVRDALDVLGCRAEVVSLDPSGLRDVIACIALVGEATNTTKRAGELMSNLRERLEGLNRAVAGRGRPRTLALEWSDPPFNGGHWIPDMVIAAGGAPVLGSPGEPSRRLAWSEIADAAPEVVVFMPCGYDLAQATVEGTDLLKRQELSPASEIYAVPANAYFSRPGPRIIDGVEILASLLHPDALIAASPDRVARLR
jgi:iron complex transport system substrate-binding protein